MKKIKEIKKEKLLLVEGRDEEVFFEALFRKRNISEIQIMESGGKEQFAKELPEIIKLPNFRTVSSLAVVQDADQSAGKTFKSICSVLKKNALKAPDKPASFISGPPKIGVFIIPGENNPGMLESLCLSTVESGESKGLLECVDSFIDCVKKESIGNTLYKTPKNFDKARCRAFLAAMEEDTSALGIAAEKGYWNLSSDKLKLLLDFLNNL